MGTRSAPDHPARQVYSLLRAAGTASRRLPNGREEGIDMLPRVGPFGSAPNKVEAPPKVEEGSNDAN